MTNKTIKVAVRMVPTEPAKPVRAYVHVRSKGPSPIIPSTVKAGIESMFGGKARAPRPKFPWKIAMAYVGGGCGFIIETGGGHVTIRRIALTPGQLDGLPSFPAADKIADSRYKWFVSNYGKHCWELDAMDPNDLRDCVRQNIIALIEPVAWAHCEMVNKAEHESLKTVLDNWKVARGG